MLDKLAAIASIVTGLALALSAASVVLTRLPGVVGLLALQPLRSAAPRRQLRAAGRANLRLRVALGRQLLRGDAARLATADIVWAAIGADCTPEDGSEPCPDAMRRLHRIVDSALEPRRSGAVMQYLAAAAWRQNAEILRQCRDYMVQFIHLALVPDDELKPLELAGRGQGTFAEFASVFSGASVLVDMTQVQGGVGSRSLVMHRPEWRGAAEIHGAKLVRGRNPYERRHAGSAARVGSMTRQVAGQYDGRIPTLLSARLAVIPGVGGVRLLITTQETCYSATEPPADPARLLDPATSLPCKGLAVDDTDPYMATFWWVAGKQAAVTRPGRDAAGGVGGAGEADGGARGGVALTPQRPVQLNVVLGLVCTGDGARTLVLTRRSQQVRNGGGGLSAASGGVVEMAVRDRDRDCDRFGALDPLAGTLRELEEELGLGADDVIITPQAVYLANGRNEPATSRRRDTGQLVSTVLHIGVTPLTIEQVRDKAGQADPVEGAFEWEKLLGVELGASAADFAANLAGSDGSDVAGVPLIDQMDQPSVLTALYAAARFFGPTDTVAAFVERFGEPWWTLPWPSDSRAARVCRPPGMWVARGGAAGAGAGAGHAGAGRDRADVAWESAAAAVETFWGSPQAAAAVSRARDNLRAEVEGALVGGEDR